MALQHASPSDGLRYLSARAVAEVPVTYADVREIVRENLRAKADGLVENPAKPGIHPMPNAFIHAMPGYVAPRQAAGVKWVSGFPDNPAEGLPYISGLIVLNDPRTGLPTTIMDAGRITALRTACVSGLAIEVLRAAPLRSAAIIGCGVQGRAHVEMILELFPQVEQLRLFDVLPEIAEQAASGSGKPRACLAVRSLQAAVEGADAIITAVAERDVGSAIRSEWIADGAVLLPLASPDRAVSVGM
jgi:ornithine cyclodeaminase/alanine dehydrogenase-like protein (mu-crystallin family)